MPLPTVPPVRDPLEAFRRQGSQPQTTMLDKLGPALAGLPMGPTPPSNQAAPGPLFPPGTTIGGNNRNISAPGQPLVPNNILRGQPASKTTAKSSGGKADKAKQLTGVANLEPSALVPYINSLSDEQRNALYADPDIGGDLKKMVEGYKPSIHEILNPAAATTADKPLVDPLAVQLFFAQTIAPYLNQQGDAMRATGDQYKTSMNQLLAKGSNLPEAYRGVLAASVPAHQQAYGNLASALQGAAVAGPALDQLMKAINESRNASIKNYYAQQAGGGLGGADLGSIMASFGVKQPS